MTEIRGDGSTSLIRTLYVDDDEHLLELTREYLEANNSRIEVETAASPERGLALLADREFDAVVSDFQMPEMNGLELLETVREERDDGIPFIIFSGKGRKEVAIDALNLGADRYVRKGGDPSSQYGVLARAPSNRRPNTTAPSDSSSAATRTSRASSNPSATPSSRRTWTAASRG